MGVGADQLTSTCDFAERTDEFVRDQIVARTMSRKLRQRLLTEPDLALTRALATADTIESTEREAQAMETPQHSAPHPSAPTVYQPQQVQAISRGSSRRKRRPQQPGKATRAPMHQCQAQPQSQASSEGFHCFGCGRRDHKAG